MWLDAPEAHPAGTPARRGSDRALANRALAGTEKGAEEKGQTVLFVDESGFYPLPAVVRTFAPEGQTPVLRELCTRDHLSVISGISPEGKLYYRVQEEPFNSLAVVGFLTHLLRVIRGLLLVIWDGAMIHRSKEIKAFLAAGAARRLQLERLPGYAPDLNPDEGIWSHLKNVELRNLCARDLDHLRCELDDAIKRVRRRPRIIKGCFAGAGMV